MSCDIVPWQDAELYNSMRYILENDPEPLCLDFSINKTVYGQVSLTVKSWAKPAVMSGVVQVIEVDLKPGGRDIPVTEANKKEYVE